MYLSLYIVHTNVCLKPEKYLDDSCQFIKTVFKFPLQFDIYSNQLPYYPFQ